MIFPSKTPSVTEPNTDDFGSSAQKQNGVQLKKKINIENIDVTGEVGAEKLTPCTAEITEHRYRSVHM